MSIAAFTQAEKKCDSDEYLDLCHVIENSANPAIRAQFISSYQHTIFLNPRITGKPLYIVKVIARSNKDTTTIFMQAVWHNFLPRR